MHTATNQRYVSWSSHTYGHQIPPGVIAYDSFKFDGFEGSHLGEGWHACEDGFRWAQQEATLYLLRSRGQDVLELEVWAGPKQLGPVELTIDAGGSIATKKVQPNSWRKLQVALPSIKSEKTILRVTLRVPQMRNASALGNSDTRDLGVAVRAARLNGKSTANEFPLSAVCNPAHWDDPLWQQFLQGMACDTSHTRIAQEVFHRKMWEWIQGVSGLVRLGCIRPDAVGLGVAAGHEPVIYWLASRIAQVYATDVYSGSFHGHEANSDVLHDPDKYATYPYPRERVHFFPMDGIHISFADETVDFIFSFCSIEHFGSRANSRRSLQEMARVLKPGGIAAVSTEVSLNDVGPQEEVFSPWELYEELVSQSGMFLIGDIAPANLATLCAEPLDVSEIFTSSKPHLVLHDNGVVFTSVMLFMQKVQVISYGNVATSHQF